MNDFFFLSFFVFVFVFLFCFCFFFVFYFCSVLFFIRAIKEQVHSVKDENVPFIEAKPS